MRSDAADWHSEYMERAQDKEDYEEWDKSLITRYLTETEIENLRKQLSELKQTADKNTQTFVNRINQLYDIIHGKEIIIDFRTASAEAKALAIYLDKIRSEAKMKILLKGLSPKIEKVVWSRMDVNSSYEDVCDMAYAAETIVNRMEQNEDKSLKATIAGISAHEDEQDVEMLPSLRPARRFPLSRVWQRSEESRGNGEEGRSYRNRKGTSRSTRLREATHARTPLFIVIFRFALCFVC